jgi:hypothetical protein
MERNMNSYFGRLGIVIVTLLATACLAQTDDPRSYIAADEMDVELAPDPQDLSVRYARGTFAPSEMRELVDEASAAESASIRHQIADGTILATNDGRVYNVTTASNIRSCASTTCTILRVASAGADLPNDGSNAPRCDGTYCWIRVVYSYASNNACETSKSYGWVITKYLASGNPYVLSGPLNIRQSSCNGTLITSVSAGTQLSFYQVDSQWSNKWYEVRVPGNFFQAGWIDGWDFADVR